MCDWDDTAARDALLDALVRDGLAVLAVLDDAGRFRIVRGVAAERVLSTVDPDARHGHKSTARGFDGYKGHAAVDPDCEVITDAASGPPAAATPR